MKHWRIEVMMVEEEWDNLATNNLQAPANTAKEPVLRGCT